MPAAGTYPGYYSARLRGYLEHNLQEFSGLPISDRQQFAYLFHAIYHTKHAHRIFVDYCSIPQRILRAWFGRSHNRDRFKIIVERYGWIEIKPTYRFGSTKSFTKGYKLSSAVKSILDSYFDSLLSSPLEKTSISKFNGRRVKTLPAGAIHSVDKNQNPAKCRAQLRSAIAINYDAIWQELRYVKQLWDYRHFEHTAKPGASRYSTWFRSMNPARLNKTLSQLEQLYELSFNDLLPCGQILQRYEESASGRLYGCGIHLQNVVSEVKKVALSGLNLIEYDLSNCHYSILCQIARQHDMRCPIIQDYLENKSAVRAALASELNVPVHLIKQCLIGLIYGASTVPYYKNSIPELIGAEKAKQLFKNPWFSRLKKEVDAAGQAIISSARHYGQTIINQMGKTINCSRKHSHIVAHLLQGYEAKMLNLVLELYGDQIVVLQHDGWVCEPPINVGKIEECIRDRLNISIRVEQEINFVNFKVNKNYLFT